MTNDQPQKNRSARSGGLPKALESGRMLWGAIYRAALLVALSRVACT
ncbi:MAG: hypothetical protein WCF44_10365 [Candidatus Methylophosphatis roskildensis]